MTAKILIVDDHDVVRQGTRAILHQARPQWEICGEAATGREAIAAVATLHPDVVILDISMPDMTGIEAAPAIEKLDPNCKILLFTMHESDALLEEARQLGVRGYVQKTRAGRDLVLALDRLLAGQTFFGPSGNSGMASSPQGDAASGGGAPQGRPGSFSKRAASSVKPGRREQAREGKFLPTKEDLTASARTPFRRGFPAKLILQHLHLTRCGVWLAPCLLANVGKRIGFSWEGKYGDASFAGG